MRGKTAKKLRRILRDRGDRYSIGTIGEQKFNEYREAMKKLKREWKETRLAPKT